MTELKYYPKNENDTYAFFYDAKSKSAWAVHMPRIPYSHIGVGRDVGTLEKIESEEEAIEQLKRMVDNL